MTQLGNKSAGPMSESVDTVTRMTTATGATDLAIEAIDLVKEFDGVRAVGPE